MNDAAIRAAYDPEPDWAGLRPPASGAEEAADPRLPQSAGPSVTRRGHALVLLIEAPVQEEPASRAGVRSTACPNYCLIMDCHQLSIDDRRFR